jgi:hypothetical protein
VKSSFLFSFFPQFFIFCPILLYYEVKKKLAKKAKNVPYLICSLLHTINFFYRAVSMRTDGNADLGPEPGPVPWLDWLQRRVTSDRQTVEGETVLGSCLCACVSACFSVCIVGTCVCWCFH